MTQPLRRLCRVAKQKIAEKDAWNTAPELSNRPSHVSHTDSIEWDLLWRDILLDDWPGEATELLGDAFPTPQRDLNRAKSCETILHVNNLSTSTYQFDAPQILAGIRIGHLRPNSEYEEAGSLHYPIPLAVVDDNLERLVFGVDYMDHFGEIRIGGDVIH
jgi:hypothetical protein